MWNDVEQWSIAAIEAYKHANIPDVLTVERLTEAFDVPVSEVIYTLGASRDLPQENHDRLLKTFTETLYKLDHLSSVRDGAREALEYLEGKNIINHLVSNHPLSLLERELEKGDLRGFFDLVQGNETHGQVYNKATKAQRIKKHLQDTGIKPCKTCIIADTREEIRIAHEFGMVSVALTGGYNSEKVLKQEFPDHLIHSLREIPKLIA